MIFSTKKYHLIINFKTLICLLAIIGLSQTGNSQNINDEDFLDLVETVTTKKTEIYSELEKAFELDRNDTLKMKFLATKSHAKNYLEGESFALNSLGIFYRNKSLFFKAFKAHDKALKLAVKAENKHLEVVSLNMLGVVNRRTDNIRKALDYHQQALSLAESQTVITEDLKKSIAVSLNSMGNIYLALKQYDIALQQFNKSIAIEKELENKLGLAINYQNIGYAQEAKGDLESALKNYTTSLGYNEEINSKVGKVICNNSIGQVYIKQGKYKEAIAIIKPTVKLAEDIGDQFYISSVCIGLGWAQSNLGLLDSAEKNLIKGLKSAEEYNLPSSIAEANLRLSELNQKKGNANLALEQYKKAVEINENISNENNSQYVNALLIQYETEKKVNQIQTLASENEIVKLKLKESQKTLLFALLGLLLVGVAFFAYNRQRQLKSEKKILTLEQDMLRSQMNPHFIFNSLNSIKLYIINNEKENAVYYLNKFSKLIRKILVASTEKQISLAEELETMTLYMNIENIRFSNEINYEVKIADSVNLEVIKVPSLILQPFLENALWHGLSTKKDNKNIDLEIAKTNSDFITITITDNGIGRRESEKINKNKFIKSTSIGIKLTKERLANFFKGQSNMHNIEIKDLYDANNNSLGTQVIITIPINTIPKLRTA